MESGHINRNKMTSNDGESIPVPKKGAENAGFLNRDTVYSNNEVFERDRIGGTPAAGKIANMHSWRKEQNLDDPGFDAEATHIHKNGTPYGEAAYFNQLPPGMDIEDQRYALINAMPFREYTGGITYPGDSPWPVRKIET